MNIARPFTQNGLDLRWPGLKQPKVPCGHCQPFRMASANSLRTVVCETSSDLVDEILTQVALTDRGMDLSDERRRVVDGLISKLEEVGRQQVPRPLANPLIFGNYNVAYVSTANAPKQGGQPAGGRFRGKGGRAIFKTERLCQSVLEPNLVTNKVEWKLFGLLPGYVGLRGTFKSVGEGEDTVEVQFDPPQLQLGQVVATIGPQSSVVLTTTYLDERIRLGKGSRGSLFVFTRGGPCDEAAMDKVGLARTTPLGWALLGGLTTGTALVFARLWVNAGVAPRVGLALCVLACLYVCRPQRFSSPKQA